MRSGQLRNYVRIERPIDTPDGQGGFTRSWELISEQWAAVEPISSADRLQAGAVEGRVSDTVRIRYIPDTIGGDCRIVYGNRTLHLVGPPINVAGKGGGNNRELQFLCTEKA